MTEMNKNSSQPVQNDIRISKPVVMEKALCHLRVTACRVLRLRHDQSAGLDQSSGLLLRLCRFFT